MSQQSVAVTNNANYLFSVDPSTLAGLESMEQNAMDSLRLLSNTLASDTFATGTNGSSSVLSLFQSSSSSGTGAGSNNNAALQSLEQEIAFEQDQQQAVLNAMFAAAQAQQATQQLTPSIPSTTAPASALAGSPTLAQQGFDITSWGDPHQNETIGTTTAQQNNMQSIPDLLTIEDASSGPVSISTKTYQPDSTSSVTYNKKVKLTFGSGNQGYTVAATHDTNTGNLKVTLTDNFGAKRTITNGQSITQPDGTVIGVNGNQLMVTGTTISGGTYTTTVTNQTNGLDLESSSKGPAVIEGWAVDQAFGKTSGGTVSPSAALQPSTYNNLPGTLSPSYSTTIPSYSQLGTFAQNLANNENTLAAYTAQVTSSPQYQNSLLAAEQAALFPAYAAMGIPSASSASGLGGVSLMG